MITSLTAVWASELFFLSVFGAIHLLSAEFLGLRFSGRMDRP